MKKTYIQPETVTVKLKMQSAILQGSPLGKYDDETLNTNEILVKQNWGSFWDQWAGAAGE